MEELKFKYEQLNKGVMRLRQILGKYQKAYQDLSVLRTEDTEDEYAIRRDSLIKRFEICYELLWKYLKTVLKVRYSIDSNSPRKVFQDCFSQNIVTEAESRVLLDMVKSRNETTHMYDEPYIDVLAKAIAGYIDLLKSIADRCSRYQ